jgi:LacI family transcriptional regulator
MRGARPCGVPRIEVPISDVNRPTIRDVAKLAGVDRAVVSRIVNDDPKLSVRSETRERVLAAISTLDYRPNNAARSLRTARASAFGLIVPDFQNPVYSEIIEGAQDAALSMNCALLTASVSRSEATAARRFIDILGNGAVDGLLIAGSVRAEDLVQSFRARGRPVLSVNRRIRDLPRYVILDDARAAEVGVDHLIGLGHTRIAHIAGPSDSDTAERRLAGYRSALAQAGLTAPTSYIAHSDYTPIGGYEAMRGLLAQDEPPTAVLVANITSALGALAAARASGVSVPGDLSVLSVHDSELAAFASPPLTVVSMPLYELGKRAVQLLMGSPEEAQYEVVATPVTLLERESTAPPKAS